MSYMRYMEKKFSEIYPRWRFPLLFGALWVVVGSSPFHPIVARLSCSRNHPLWAWPCETELRGPRELPADGPLRSPKEC